MKLVQRSGKLALTGEIQNQRADGRYTVKVGSRNLIVESGLSSTLKEGTLVVMTKNNDDGKLYIVSSGGIKNRVTKEVSIDG
jgi:hypothetical protein